MTSNISEYYPTFDMEMENIERQRLVVANHMYEYEWEQFNNTTNVLVFLIDMLENNLRAYENINEIQSSLSNTRHTLAYIMEETNENYAYFDDYDIDENPAIVNFDYFELSTC
jgi:hypothetical protein